MNRVLPSLLFLSLFALPADAAPRKRRPVAPPVTIATAGSEQAVKVGDTVLSRPFGAALVDTLSVVGQAGAGAERYALIRGAGGSDCPARYLIVTARTGQPPQLSAPFGTCQDGASIAMVGRRVIVTVPSPEGRVARYAYDNNSVTAIVETAGVDEVQAPVVDGCADRARIATLTSSELAVELDRTLPASLRRMRDVKRAEIAPADLRRMVTGLACYASVPGSGETVPRAAESLFASKRYGEAAFAALDSVARAEETSPDLAATVRAFSADMRYFVDRREPI